MHLPSRQQKAAISRNDALNESQQRPSNSAMLPWVLRFTYCTLGIGIIGLLLLSRTLSPDPSGIGTHEQLGFPPCGFKLVSGSPCPSCGMTTSWALATRGRLIASADSNAGGFLMALLALPAGAWLIATGYKGRWVVREPNPFVVSGVCVVVVMAALIQWAIRIQLF